MTTLHLEIVGCGPPLVLLHGWGWHSGIWQPLVPFLEKKFQLFLIDLPGFGKSPITTPRYTLETIGKQILTITPPQATWLGWSLGGLFASWIAIHYPERVIRLVTVASSPKFIQDQDWPGIPIAVLRQFNKALLNDYKKTLSDFLKLQLRGSPNNNDFLSELETQLSMTKPTALPALLGGLKLLAETDLRADLSKLNKPSLHIFGNLDTIVPIGLIDCLKPLLPLGQCITIKRAGHIPFLAQVESFLRLF